VNFHVVGDRLNFYISILLFFVQFFYVPIISIVFLTSFNCTVVLINHFEIEGAFLASKYWYH
jgi:hypothetical protein